jgi:hypothetical protein
VLSATVIRLGDLLTSPWTFLKRIGLLRWTSSYVRPNLLMSLSVAFYLSFSGTGDNARWKYVTQEWKACLFWTPFKTW